MVKLLLVRSVGDIHCALKAANEFLAYQRIHSGVTGDEVLAIWVKGNLDADLPAWFRFSHEVERPQVRPVEARLSDAVPGEAELGIRETFSLAGVWALCWIDGPVLRAALSSAERRDTILRRLVDVPYTAGSLTDPGGFFPVFGADEPAALIEAILSDLRARYPHLVGERWFREDKARGIVPAESPIE